MSRAWPITLLGLRRGEKVQSAIIHFAHVARNGVANAYIRRLRLGGCRKTERQCRDADRKRFVHIRNAHQAAKSQHRLVAEKRQSSDGFLQIPTVLRLPLPKKLELLTQYI